MKKISITKLTVNLLVFVSVIGIIALLVSVNFKLLSRLDWVKISNQNVETIILIVSAFAFALGSMSIVIWYNPEPTDTRIKRTLIALLKVTFVMIDGLHVFIYNNEHIKDLSYWLSPIYGFQTALILFFIGNVAHNIINENSNEKQKAKDIQFEFLTSKFQAIKSKIEQYDKNQITMLETHNKLVEVSSELNNRILTSANKLTKLTTIVKMSELKIKKLTNKTTLHNNELKNLLKETEKYKTSHILKEKSRILKKKESNRTAEENEILKQAENLAS